MGLLNRRFLFNAEMDASSSAVISKLVTSKFSKSLFWELDLGMTAIPRWVAHRRRTWAGVFPCFLAMVVMVSWVKRVGVS